MASDYEQRFGGIGRLYSAEGLKRLRRAHVCVVGVGGVGSWAVEALARSGIGALTLVDLDEVCVSNINRQLHSLDGEIGKAKAEVMAQRAQAINPECRVQAVVDFFTAATAQDILATPFDYVLDAIDNVPNKCLLIARCREKNIPVITVGGAGGRRDPSGIRVADLGESTHDRLLQSIRKTLRKEYGFPQEPRARFGVDCVFSAEPQVYPQPDGTVCLQRDPGSDLRLTCGSGYGTASFVTGAFGFVAAAHVVKKLSGQG